MPPIQLLSITAEASLTTTIAIKSRTMHCLLWDVVKRMRQTRKERLKPSDTGLHAIHGEKAGAKTGFWQKGSSGCLWNRSQFQCRTRGDLSAESNRSIDESIGQHEGHPVSSKRMYHTVRFVFEPEHSDEGESSVLRFDVLCRKGLSLQRCIVQELALAHDIDLFTLCYYRNHPLDDIPATTTPCRDWNWVIYSRALW
mmetsp:Transcript_13387/g.30916  ORF Transcript_13387/g.30916 Transcript_13387/m.30916 type:complete len:198 (-) Transcript_13387:432-1025(-)